MAKSMRFSGWMVALLSALVLAALPRAARAKDIFGYVDDKGVAHFASDKLDERYQLFFRGGQSFDTANGLGRGRGGPTGGKVPRAPQALISMFEASPSYKPAQGAMREAARRNSI